MLISNILLLWALCGSSASRAEPGMTSAGLLKRPVSARAMGMADSYAALDGGVGSLGYNPAALAALKRPALETSYARGLTDDQFNFLGYAYPFSFGVLSAGALYYNAGKIALNLSNGVQETRTAQEDVAALASVSLPAAQGLSLGATAKFFRLELAEEVSASGAAFDVGVLWYAPIVGINLGGSIQNLGPEVKFEAEKEPLPLTTRLGASLHLDAASWRGLERPSAGASAILLTVDAVKIRRERLSFGAGLEFDSGIRENGNVLFRIGHFISRDIDAFTAGLGLRAARLAFDYAFGLKKAGNDSHQFSLGLKF